MGKLVYGQDSMKDAIVKAFPRKGTVATANALLEKMEDHYDRPVNKQTMRRRIRELVNSGVLRVDDYQYLEHNRYVSGYRLA